MATKKLRAAIYCRISYDEKAGTQDEGLGIERQQEDCLKLVEREGWTLVGVYSDNSVSAWKGGTKKPKHRPEWTQMLGACVEGLVDVVVAWRGDRLWRNVVEERQVSAMLHESGVQTIALANGRRYKLGDADDAMLSAITTLFDEHESAVKSVRTKRTMRQLAEQGRWRGGTRPFGYRRVTQAEVEAGEQIAGALVPVDGEAEVVNELFHRVLAGESLKALSLELHDRDVPTVTGGHWRSQTLRRMLTNPVYAGINHFHGENIGEGRWPAIVDRDTFEAASSMIEARVRGPGLPPTYLLTSTLKCYSCGHPMRHTHRRGKRYYECRTDRQAGSCGGPSVTAEPAEQVVVEQVLALLADSDALAQRVAAASHIDLKSVSRRVVADRKRLDSLITDFYSGDVPKSAYLMAKTKLERRIAEAEDAIRDATETNTLDAPLGNGKALAVWWEDATPDQRRTLLNAVVERIDLQPWDPRMGRRFDEDRLRIMWRY